MKRSNIILILLITLATGIAILVIIANPTIKNLRPEIERENTLSTQTKTVGPVTIAVAPQKNNGANSLSLQIILDTHSVELADDLTQTAILIADGKEYRPTAWRGDPAGGHHREGILEFAAPATPSAPITLKILRLGGAPETVFIWQSL